MSKTDDVSCECGSIQYGYYCDNACVFICYKCGKIYCEGFSKKIRNVFENEPRLVLQMIQDGYLMPLENSYTKYDV